MSKKRVLILGAGLAGLSAAWHLQKRGRDCQIFEKETEIGGLCRSKKIDGFTFDCDGHLLHFTHRYTFKLIKSLLKDNLIEHQRSAWVYSCGRYTRYPFQAKLHGLAPSVIKDCLLGLFEISKNGHPKSKKNLSFLDWINYTFGKGIARHFMIPYNAKFWTLPPKELTCEWLDGFIPVPSLSQIIEGTIEESQRQFGYNVHFWYPKKGGINQLALALASNTKHINTDCKIVEINPRNKYIRLASGDKEGFDYLISTLPMPELASLIKGLPAELIFAFNKLRWNSIFNLNLGLKRKNNDRKHWTYFPQKEISFFRIGFFHNFSSNLTPSDGGSLYIEVAYSKDKPIDKNRILFRIKEDLKKIGIINEQDIILAHDINDIKYGYPIYDFYYDSARKLILEYLMNQNIFSCGRYGSWRYMSMEDVILDGKRIAGSITKNV